MNKEGDSDDETLDSLAANLSGSGSNLDTSFYKAQYPGFVDKRRYSYNPYYYQKRK